LDACGFAEKFGSSTAGFEFKLKETHAPKEKKEAGAASPASKAAAGSKSPSAAASVAASPVAAPRTPATSGKNRPEVCSRRCLGFLLLPLLIEMLARAWWCGGGRLPLTWLLLFLCLCSDCAGAGAHAELDAHAPPRQHRYSMFTIALVLPSA
jgi:hypothetical protein